MIVVWGKVAGLVVGVFGGVVGAAFGLFLGHLLDVVAAEYVLRRALARFVAPEPFSRPRWFNAAAAVAALSVAFVSEKHWRPSPNDSAAFRLATSIPRLSARSGLAMWGLLAIGTARTGRYLDAALHLQSEIDPEHLAVRIMTAPSAVDRTRVIEVCRSTLDSAVRGAVLERLTTLARLVGLPDEWIAATLSSASESCETSGIDDIDCEILGVGSDATEDEVKRAYRTLASQFHPDTMAELSDHQKEASSAAFVRIRSAYDRALRRFRGRA